MNPGKSGWLAEYLEYRSSFPEQEVYQGQHPDESLYRLIQPTGVMYGQPVNAVAHPDMETWSAKSRMKILLVESLLNSSFLFQQKSTIDLSDTNSIVIKIADFYIDVYPDLSVSKTTLFGKKKPTLQIAEKVIDRRIESNYMQDQNFWSRFFNNSLLFVDIYLFGQWLHTHGDRMIVEFLKEEKKNLYNKVCQVMAAAAHSNKNIEDEERRLFALFVGSTGLSSEDKKNALKLFENGLSLMEINFPENTSWIVKKYYLELSSLTIWADKKVEKSEVQFLTELCQMLGLSDDDFENSMIAVEGFVINHWQELDYLQTKRNFEIVSERFADRLSRMILKNKQRMIAAIHSDLQLRKLFIKASTTTLKEAEIQELEHRFFIALKNIPAFRIIELPQKFLEYRVIKRIIPETIIRDILNNKEALED
ncbi:MAG: hypothetical protein ACNS60_02800 [Candidatus Cyclobacteriaceae bacterium M2_1C_046]